jgi:hypothetical protein
MFGPKVALALMLASAALASGCGGGNDKKASESPSSPAGASAALGQDATAKSDARNLVSQIESCYVDSADYTPCSLKPDGTVGGSDTGLPAGTGPGQVSSTASATGYVVTAKSESGNSFVITKDANGPSVRTCTTKGKGGCPASGPSADAEW